MFKRILFFLTLSAATIAAVAGSTGTPKGAAPAFAQANVQPDSAIAEKLATSYDITGNGNSAALPQYSYTTVAQSTIKCNHAHGCSFGLASMAQVQTSGGDWAICLLVDGTSVSCQYQGVQSGPSGFVVGNARGWATGIASGNHVVALQLYAEGTAAAYAYYELDVGEYTP
ncbi:MAG TPA: hypothetical protein VH328_06885 [Burkholderiaceae bacterium]|nr:hypothetical protein [Burkholderiaceae bacterium]